MLFSRDRLFDPARVFGLRLAPRSLSKSDAVLAVSRFFDRRVTAPLLQELSPDELRRVCALYEIPSADRNRMQLIDGISAELGVAPQRADEPRNLHGATLPAVGATVLARGRQWMVESVALGNGLSQSALVRLS